MPPLVRLFRHAVRLVLSALLVGWSGFSLARPLQVLTDEFAPYTMAVNGRATGFTVEIVTETLRRAGLAVPIQMLPWARAYDIAMHADGVLIFPVLRTPAREGAFRWVGEVSPIHWYLMSIGERHLQLKSLEDARRYQIATEDADAGEQFLLSKGFRIGVNLQSTDDDELNYQKLKAGRVDLWIVDDLSSQLMWRQDNEAPHCTLAHALPLPELDGSTGLYMAFSKGTPDAVVEHVRQAFDSVRRDGTYARIIHKWQ